MARKVFFSFHYQRDIWRVNQVRHSWVTKGNQAAGYIDAADFEKIERQGHDAVTRWIDSQLEGTSVTVVLIGAETASREYVQHEILQSLAKKNGAAPNGLMGVYIHQLKNHEENTDYKGANPFAAIRLPNGDNMERMFRTYDWIGDKGQENFGSWVELAAQQAGR